MIKLDSVTQYHQWKPQSSIALVPTMGNLHQGHLSLIETAKKQADKVVVSIFVNPTQFGINEDFDNYPRTLSDDFEQATASGADAIFCPSVNEMYPYGEQNIWVKDVELSSMYCGVSRPTHFQGVATVVAKLLNITQPNFAYFGKKDFQQFIIIKKMVAQLNFQTTILAGETIRAENGLALSSRNQYLSTKDKTLAPLLYRQLNLIKKEIEAGNKDFDKLCQQAIQELNHNQWQMDYIAVANQHNLIPATAEDYELVILAAGKLAQTRLIDNIDFSI